MSTGILRAPLALTPLSGLAVVLGVLAVVRSVAASASAATGTVFKIQHEREAGDVRREAA